ncbi:MAG: hypothetical protein H3C62_00350 [Gemmatimonadaceae bacterium]|nr:hypothetical protein [Gemmatimonadaceae bacterium]
MTSMPLSSISGGGSLRAAIVIDPASPEGAPISVLAYQRGATVRMRLTCLRCGFAKSADWDTDDTPSTEAMQAWAAPTADVHETAGCVPLHAEGRPLDVLLDEAVAKVLGDRTDGFFDLIQRLSLHPTAETEVVVASRSQGPLVLDATPAGMAALHTMGPHDNLASHDRVLTSALEKSSHNVTACVVDGGDLAPGGRRWYFLLPQRTIALETAPGDDSLLLTSGQDAGPASVEMETLQPINHMRLVVATVLAAP